MSIYFTFTHTNWKEKMSFGWNQYLFTVTFNDNGNNTPIGNYIEWKAGYYLSDPVDGGNYFAVAMESCMSPLTNQSTLASSDYLRIKCDLTLGASGQLLKSYAPTQSPSTNTYSFSIGSSLSKGGGTVGEVGASWSTNVSDLQLLDSSFQTPQTMDIKFNYKWPFGSFTSYSTHTSWQDSCVIAKCTSKTAQISNQRTAQFAWDGMNGRYTGYSGNTLTSTIVRP
jgi:hypothetical protein